MTHGILVKVFCVYLLANRTNEQSFSIIVEKNYAIKGDKTEQQEQCTSWNHSENFYTSISCCTCIAYGRIGRQNKKSDAKTHTHTHSLNKKSYTLSLYMWWRGMIAKLSDIAPTICPFDLLISLRLLPLCSHSLTHSFPLSRFGYHTSVTVGS